MQVLHDDISTLNDAVFGYWRGGERVPGLMEQNNNIITLIQEHHDQFTSITDKFSEIAWGIGKPIISLLGVGIILAIFEVFTHVKLDGLLKAGGL